MAIGSNTSEQSPGVKLFIEGIETPFQQITVQTSAGGLPSATISIPPLPRLNDIARFYHPKVHIFFLDLDYIGDPEDATKDDYRVLFNGIISSVGYHRARGTGASASISFTCAHRNVTLEGINFQYTARGPEAYDSANTTDTVVKPLKMNSQTSTLLAMRGVNANADHPTETNTQPENYEALLSNMDSTDYFPRLQGIPGVLLNFWNQLKVDTYITKALNVINTESMTDMYIPHVEDGLRFFNRMSGHPALEREIEAGRENVPDELKTELPIPDNVLVPPSLRETLEGAAGAHLSVILGSMHSSFSGEGSTLASFMGRTTGYLDYRMLTLTSPVKNPVEAVETIIRPSMDYYYAPTCNVLLPNMYDSVQVSENTYDTPTRIICAHTFMLGQNEKLLRYRAPQSIREAASNGKDLFSAMGLSNDGVGKFEWGRGIRSSLVNVPPWLQYLYADKNESGSIGDVSSYTENDAADIITNLYRDQYPNTPDSLKPWSAASKLNAYQRLMFTTLDQLYGNAVGNTRAGTCSGAFNPYMVPGYNMDIVSPDETSPSYHALCETVTHTITERSINTSYSFRKAMTFEEMYSYYLPPMAPWLLVKMGFEDKLSLIENSTALAKANSFYGETLRVGAAPLEVIHDFNTGKRGYVHRDRQDDSPFVESSLGEESQLNPESGLESNPNLTVAGSLNLARREIESMSDLENSFGVEFVELTYEDYTPSKLSEIVGVSTGSTGLLEPGQSPYLDYDTEQITVTGSTDTPEDTTPGEVAPEVDRFLGFRNTLRS